MSPNDAYYSLSDALINAVSSGDFTAAMQSYAVTYGAQGFYNATSDYVSIVGPVIASPSPAPSSPSQPTSKHFSTLLIILFSVGGIIMLGALGAVTVLSSTWATWYNKKTTLSVSSLKEPLIINEVSSYRPAPANAKEEYFNYSYFNNASLATSNKCNTRHDISLLNRLLWPGSPAAAEPDWVFAADQ
jgi:hypothetical protein